jgi:hypothetical protein
MSSMGQQLPGDGSDEIVMDNPHTQVGAASLDGTMDTFPNSTSLNHGPGRRYFAQGTLPTQTSGNLPRRLNTQWPPAYKRTQVLLLSWADIDPSMVFDAECAHLTDIYGNKYGVAVTICKLQVPNTKGQLQKTLVLFAGNLRPDDLAIVHYSGHGSASICGGFMLASSAR